VFKTIVPNERLPSEQTKCVNSTVSNIREDITKCNDGIKKCHLDTEHNDEKFDVIINATHNRIRRQNQKSGEFLRNRRDSYKVYVKTHSTARISY
jgi:hypothetical protein